MEHDWGVRESHPSATVRRRDEPKLDPRLALSAALGNQAIARLVNKRLLQRTVWRWNGRQWVYQSGRRGKPRPTRPPGQRDELYDDEDAEERTPTDEQPPRGEKKREREEEPNSITAWLEQDKEAESAYYDEDADEDERVFPETVFHSIVKDDQQKACFEWALRGMGELGPNPEHFWLWLMGQHAEPTWLAPLARDVQQELQRMTQAITPLIRSQANNWGDIPARRQGAAKEFVTDAMRILVQQCGFTLADDATAPGWVVCQYKKTEGAAFPEHFWLEVRKSDGGTLVVQTVSGLEVVEVGGTDLRWHSPSSAQGRDAEVAEYELVRIPVAALLPRQVAVLRTGMQSERSRKKAR